VIKKILKKIMPPILLDILTYLFNRKYGWYGDYNCWADAQKKCSGYDSAKILERVRTAILKVKNGEAVYERDSVLFNSIQFSWPLLASFLLISKETNETLNVLDFGGSLGSTYFQNRNILEKVVRLSWNIVEQKKFVEVGKTDFQDNNLKFYETIDLYKKTENPHVLLLSSVLQYIENPYEFLEYVLSLNIKYILLDRTAFHKKEYDRITVQKVNPKIYNASYPAWFFNEKSLLDFFNKFSYDIVFSFSSIDSYNIKSSYSKGFLFEKK